MSSPNFLVDINNILPQAEVDVAKVVFTLIICALGLLGNLFAIFVILVLREYKKSVTHWYVLQLAITDSILLLTLPFKVTEDLNHGWIYPEWMCKAKETILFLNYYASILFLMVMSIDRYIAVCHTLSFVHRLRNQNSAFIVTLCVWMAALLLCIPVMLYSVKTGNHPKCICSYEFPNPKNLTATCLEEGYYTEEEIEGCKKSFQKLDQVSGEEFCTRVNVSAFNFGVFESSGDGSSNNISNPAFLPPFGGFNIADFGANFNIEATGVIFHNEESPTESESFIDGSGGFSGGQSSIIHQACHYHDHPYGWKVFLLFNFLVMFCLPFIIMVVCYGLIIFRLSTTKIRSASTASYKKSVRNGASQKKKSASRSDKERKRVTVMCAALVTCFLVCWLPFHVIHIAKLNGIESQTSSVCEVLSVVGALLAYTNSALNPYLYSFLGTNFNKRWQLLKKNRGIQQLVSFRKHPKDSNTYAYSKDSEKMGKSQASRFNRFQPNADNKISGQRLTMLTRVQKDNESSQVQPTMQTDYSRPQSMEMLSKTDSSGTEEK